MFQFLFECTADAVWLIDPGSGAVVDCNEAAAVLMRSSSRAGLVGKRLEEFSPAGHKDASLTEEIARRITERGKNGDGWFEWALRRFDGTEVPLKVNAAAVQCDGESLIMLVSRQPDGRLSLEKVEEIVQQAEAGLRESEARLRESEERFSKAFRASPALMTISRLSDEKYVEANDAFVRWYGLRREDILGHSTKELGTWLHLEDRAKFWADLKRYGSVREVECQARNWQGTVGTLLLSAEIIEINRQPHVLGFGIDITQRKQAEAELLRTLAIEKELSQLRSQFVSIVSHEFRTPLGIIQSSAEILKDYLDQLDSAEREDIC